MEKFTGKLQTEPREFFGQKVKEIARTDGMKLVFADGSWVCYRLSGTEPVVRVYSEATSEAGLEKLSAAAKKWIFEYNSFPKLGLCRGHDPVCNCCSTVPPEQKHWRSKHSRDCVLLY